MKYVCAYLQSTRYLNKFHMSAKCFNQQNIAENMKMHLIGHQILSRDYVVKFNHGATTFRMGIVMHRFFKHSCNPNVIEVVRNGKSYGFAIKPIKQGDELYNSRVEIGIESVEEKQKHLWDIANIKTCDCPRCNGRVLSLEQRQQIVNDSAFQRLPFIELRHAAPHAFTTEQMENCIEFLYRFGRSDWCPEFGHVIVFLQQFYKACLAAKTDLNHPFSQAILSKSLRVFRQ